MGGERAASGADGGRLAFWSPSTPPFRARTTFASMFPMIIDDDDDDVFLIGFRVAALPMLALSSSSCF